jgi:dipeptidyl aminopeptidase/acylaminoacyl peptidase
MRRRAVLAAFALLIGLAPHAPAQRPPYTPEQLTLSRTTDECCLSPDGKTVAFTSDITGAVELWTVPAAGGWPEQLTGLDGDVSAVRWSPDGRWLVFTSDYGGNERRDLYRVPARGGAVEKLTDTPLSETEPRFAPDGKRLAFTADPDRDSVFQLFVLDLESGKQTRLTHEAVTVQSPVWSPDGRTLALNRSGDDERGDLLLLDAATGGKVVVEPMVAGGILWPEAFAPDGSALLLRGRNEAGFLQLAVLELSPASEAGKPPKPKGPPAFIGPGDWDVVEAAWTRAGIYALRNEGGSTGLLWLPAPQDRPVDLLPAEGAMSHLSLDRAGRRLALLREDVNRPADVWVGDLAVAAGNERPAPGTPATLRDSLRQVTFSLPAGVKAGDLAAGEMASYASFDGTKVHALLLRPPVERLGSPPPAVVCVHGGPDLQQTRSYSPYQQALAEAGFAVLAPNYRGSAGYGKAFQDANHKDWGGGDLKDLVAGVRHFGARKVLDPERVGITGGSYGGYLTLLALARTPDVWKAGAESFGMPDLVIDYQLTRSRFGPWYETQMGTPRADGALFRERSPLPYLEDVRAPLLVFQGANDTSVPKAESDLLTAVLKGLNKPCEYVVYDDEGHGFTRRRNLVDHDRRAVRFFVEHLRRIPAGSRP